MYDKNRSKASSTTILIVTNLKLKDLGIKKTAAGTTSDCRFHKAKSDYILL